MHRLTEFIKKMNSWLAMSHFDQAFCRRVELLERNFAVSNNIFKKYKPIFLDLFKDPANDLPRPPRSRKQRRPPCNCTELFHFCWTLYILIKGRLRHMPNSIYAANLLMSSFIAFSRFHTSLRALMLSIHLNILPAKLKVACMYFIFQCILSSIALDVHEILIRI